MTNGLYINKTLGFQASQCIYGCERKFSNLNSNFKEDLKYIARLDLT